MEINRLFSLEGKVAIVTGAAGLIGEQIAQTLAYSGANVVLLDIELEKCIEIAFDLPTESIAIQADICSEESLINAKNEILEKFGRIDILINNAAINEKVENPIDVLESTKFENFPSEMFQQILNVNIIGTFNCCKIFGSVMINNCSGSIINIASTYGITAPDQSLYKDKDGNQLFYKSPAYPTSKGAVIAFTKYLAAYWGHNGVRVNTLSPGGVENGQNEYFIEKYSERTPLKRMADKSDYNGAIVFLASDASSYMTGANLVVDGGWTTW